MASPSIRIAAIAVAVALSTAGAAGSPHPGSTPVAAPSVAAATVRPAPIAAGVPQRVAIPIRPWNDPDRGEQWWLTSLRAEALRAVTDASTVTVAVLDSGIDVTNPDLRAVDIDCLHGADFAADAAATDPSGHGCVDPDGHGTHIAGIIAARADDHVGVAGLTNARLLPVRVLDTAGSAGMTRIARGIDYAVAHGARVINLSLVSHRDMPPVDAAIRAAIARGVVVVAAAGNTGSTGNATSYPGATPGVLCVGATDIIGEVASFSTTGSSVDVVAPGDGITSTYPLALGATTHTESGTSMATAVVSATAAMYLSLHPAATPADVDSALERTADDRGFPGRDDAYGWGEIDPYRLLTGRTPAPAPVAVPLTGW